VASEDWLGPQFAEFNPSGNIYGNPVGEMRYSRQSPDGSVVRNSRNMANMLGRNRSEDLQAGIPTGATTDFQSRGEDFSSKFIPAPPPNELNGSIRFN
jgi:hypothetical protein